jgi:phage N-6-adenine-methyltransferase
MNESTQKLMFSSEKMDWITPRQFFMRLNSDFNFTTDVGATKENALLPDYLGLDNGRDALTSEWGAINFCNPPYGRQIGDWVKKGYFESRDGKLVVMLLPARTDTKWFHDWIFGRAVDIIFVRGRIKFSNSKTGAPFPSMVVVYDERRIHHGTQISTMWAQ